MSHKPRCRWPGCCLGVSRRKLCRSHYYSVRDLSKLNSAELTELQHRKPFLNVVVAYAGLVRTPGLAAWVAKTLPAQAPGLQALMNERRLP